MDFLECVLTCYMQADTLFLNQCQQWSYHMHANISSFVCWWGDGCDVCNVDKSEHWWNVCCDNDRSTEHNEKTTTEISFMSLLPGKTLIITVPCHSTLHKIHNFGQWEIIQRLCCFGQMSEMSLCVGSLITLAPGSLHNFSLLPI